METPTPHFLLRGVAGSTAHGLATDTSDEDLHGLFGWDTSVFWGLTPPEDSLVGHEPQDYSYHEVGKYLKLALRSNPTVLELMWLDEYIEKDEYGNWLLENRQKFLSASMVKNAYMGYATAQFQKMQKNLNQGEDGGEASVRRFKKNTRHLFRLLEAGYSLYTTGDMTVKVADPDWYFWIVDQPINDIMDEYLARETTFLEASSVLPENPDREWAEQFLFSYRKAHV